MILISNTNNNDIDHQYEYKWHWSAIQILMALINNTNTDGIDQQYKWELQNMVESPTPTRARISTLTNILHYQRIRRYRPTELYGPRFALKWPKRMTQLLKRNFKKKERKKSTFFDYSIASLLPSLWGLNVLKLHLNIVPRLTFKQMKINIEVHEYMYVPGLYKSAGYMFDYWLILFNLLIILRKKIIGTLVQVQIFVLSIQLIATFGIKLKVHLVFRYFNIHA